MFIDDGYTPIPTKWVGPIKISGNVVDESLSVPLATYESPLWPSCGRGAALSQYVDGGVRVMVLEALMTRSVVFSCDGVADAKSIVAQILADRESLDAVVRRSSRFARLLKVHHEIVGNLLFLRFSFDTGDASGHNMATKAADALLEYLLARYPSLRYSSISGNYCIDKKASAVNGILGRGKRCVAEILIPRRLCQRFLKTTPERIERLNLHKNHIGSNLAGALRSANAHYANMLLAFYLATGQDAANIIEGSQGITHCEAREDGLYFSCTLPNLIVGTVGNGKGLPVVLEALSRLGCLKERASGDNARRLAAICAAVVLCGELSLLAAQSNQGELMRAHLRLER